MQRIQLWIVVRYACREKKKGPLRRERPREIIVLKAECKCLPP
jgi:hypothetical protein